MVRFDDFEKCIHAIQSDEQFFDSCEQMGFAVYERLESHIALLGLLELSMKDEEGWISWWCYDKGFGKNKDVNAYYTNGEKIPMDTAYDLYRYLAKQQEKLNE